MSNTGRMCQAVEDEATGKLVPLRERRRAATRSEIATAAAELFERNGYENTSVEQIATAAGVSMRTFYRYCSSKDEVLGLHLTSGPDELVAAIAQHSGLPLLDAVIAGFVAVSGSVSRRRELRLILKTPALHAAWLTAGRKAQDDLVAVIVERMPNAPLLEAQARAAAIVGILTRVIEAWAADDSVALEPATQRALRVLTAW